jgi:rhodanese-related sulfurtransferase
MCQNKIQPINGQELTERLQQGEKLNLLDVREQIEYYTFNIGGSNIPLSKLKSAVNNLTYNKTDEIIVVCKIGLRSETARKLLTENGYLRARNLTGGLVALQKLKHI